MGSTPQRSFVKGMIWEFISFIVATVAVYLAYGDLGDSLKFSLLLTSIKIPLFFIHERAWKKVKWGKY